MGEKTYTVKLIFVERTMAQNKFGVYYTPEKIRQTQIAINTLHESEAQEKFEKLVELFKFLHI